MNRFIPYPTLLRTPELGDTVDLNILATWPDANHLPLEPAAYQVVHAPEGWSVRVAATGEVIYQGAGPVELVECPVPF